MPIKVAELRVFSWLSNFGQ